MSLIDDIKELGIDVSEDQEKLLTDYIGKNFVSRTDYRSKNERVKTLEKENGELKARDFASIETERDDWKQKYETLEKANTDRSKKEKFFSVLGDDCKDKDYLLYKLGGVDKIELDVKGEIKDSDNMMKKLKEDNPTYFGKTPFVVSTTAGSQTEPADGKEKANEAFRSLFGQK